MATIREVETFLFSHGISAGLDHGRLVRTFGDEVVAVLEHDPYRLIELPGVGFTIADRIARSLGVEPDAPQRLRAGLQFVLEGAEADGNTFLPLAELWPRAGKLLEVGEVEPIESAVRALAAEGEVVVDDRIYRTELWEMERRLAGLLARRAAAEPDELFAAESRPEALVSEEQWAVVELVRTRSLVLLTGLPSAGKTHTQRVLVDVARRARRRVLLCAPTGKAARRMRDLTGHEAMTIHRALGYSPVEGFQRDEDDPLSKSYDLVIVDEASMRLARARRRVLPRRGDCHVLLVGDTDQLPPIGAGRVLADLVDSGAVPRVHLTAIYRQAARSLIVRSARRINAGELPFLSPDDARASLGADVELDEDFFFIAKQEQEAMRDAVLDLVCERIPSHYGLDARTDVMTLVPMRRGAVGLTALNEELERRLNPGESAVVLARGDPRRIAHRADEERLHARSRGDERRGRVRHRVGRGGARGEAVARRRRARARRAGVGARDVHPRLGSDGPPRAGLRDFPAVVAPWSTAYTVMLSRPLLYTAVTRAEKLCVLVGERRALSMAVGRAEGRRRHSALAERILELS